jgi:hypothetical protein
VQIYLALLNNSEAPRDENGVAYRFYAQDLAALQIRSEAPDSSPPQKLAPDPHLSERIAELEQGRNIAKNIPHIRAQIESGAAWIPMAKSPGW